MMDNIDMSGEIKREAIRQVSALAKCGMFCLVCREEDLWYVVCHRRFCRDWVSQRDRLIK